MTNSTKLALETKINMQYFKPFKSSNLFLFLFVGFGTREREDHERSDRTAVWDSQVVTGEGEFERGIRNHEGRAEADWGEDTITTSGEGRNRSQVARQFNIRDFMTGIQVLFMTESRYHL